MTDQKTLERARYILHRLNDIRKVICSSYKSEEDKKLMEELASFEFQLKDILPPKSM